MVGSQLGPSQRRSKEYIHRSCNKRNAILEVHDKSIMMFFKKGLMDSYLIRKFIVKNPRMLEQMFSITNRYALAEEATVDTREQKESNHPYQPSSSKGHGKKRNLDRSINVVDRPHRNKEYRLRSNEFKDFLNCICIFHLKENTKPKTEMTPKFQNFADSKSAPLFV
jgi:hypothetical protein